MPQRTIPTSAPAPAPGRALPLKQNGPIPHPKVPQMQSPIMKRNTDNPITSVNMPTLPLSSNSGGGSKGILEKVIPSPKLYRHPLDKDKINALVKSAYKDTESDSVKVRDKQIFRLCILRTGPKLLQTKPDWIGFCLHGAFPEVAQNGFKQIQNWCCKTAGPVLD